MVKKSIVLMALMSCSTIGLQAKSGVLFEINLKPLFTGAYSLLSYATGSMCCAVGILGTIKGMLCDPHLAKRAAEHQKALADLSKKNQNDLQALSDRLQNDLAQSTAAIAQAQRQQLDAVNRSLDEQRARLNEIGTQVAELPNNVTPLKTQVAEMHIRITAEAERVHEQHSRIMRLRELNNRVGGSAEAIPAIGVALARARQPGMLPQDFRHGKANVNRPLVRYQAEVHVPVLN